MNTIFMPEFSLLRFLNRYIKENSIFKSRYESMMATCYKRYSQLECDGNERARLAMNRDQPKTQHNYTEVGFKKMKVPAEIWEPIKNFFDENKQAEKLENWPRQVS